ncbi:uncharacterized protein LOC123692157 isoform X2 [Colias croceus]|uniref:uncharacterized protein LOC123692157 isoform X2 n=1 Tax=Colias crocea TaxID=72248 RepID=UPI001E28102D|nr:uncharacterized protein LOC123692157 isoform X2 [Colias croceus]XP_045492804.1 uncharacterized protein LOC123692157 isoform X2 [Colias croceus]XP_045492805.1 uncharacterized protein LOC123692157 isoform X2 [Colias croceus]
MYRKIQTHIAPFNSVLSIEKDMANYCQYKMGFSQKIKMIDRVLPSKFHCQPDRCKRICEPSTSRSAFAKRQRINLIEQCEAEICQPAGTVDKSHEENMEHIITEPSTSEKSTTTDPITIAENFPRNPIRCSKWAAIIGRSRGEEFYKPRRGSVVCSDHFPESDMYTTTKGFRRLIRSAKPTLLLQDNKASNDNIIIKQELIEIEEETIGSAHLVPQADQEYFMNSESSYQPLHQDVNVEIKRQSPSSSLSIGSILNTPREVVMKKKIETLEKRIIDKNKKIDALRKQNKRLAKRNISLKTALSAFKKRSRIVVSNKKLQSQKLQ